MTSTAPRRVAVIGGGQNCEHDVSLASAASVAAALDPELFVAIRLTIGLDGRWHLGSHPLGTTPAGSLAAAVTVLAECDVAFAAVHGPVGEDGTLAALCRLAGVPWVGSDVRAGAAAMDKVTTKLIAESHGIATAPGTVVTAATAATARWDGPVVVKPVAAGSSHGVTLVTTADGLAPAIDAALALDDRVLVEQLVEGREVDIAVLERVDGSRFVGPALEIVSPEGSVFDLDSKYDGSADFRLPATLDDVQRKELSHAALTLFDALGCAGVTRFDFFVTPMGVVLNEVNTMPGMTAESQVPRMFAAAGMTYRALLSELVLGAVQTAR
ncbi:MAG: D-alanine--D-alanine ligase [Aeromicrobium sp.]